MVLIKVIRNVRKDEDTGEEVETAADWEVENLTLGAEAAIVCPPEPCPAVQITGCLGGSDAGSHCSSMESFLEARKPDPEELLLELGFGGPPNENDNISRIPSRFLQPSSLKGVDIEQFLKQQQEMADTIQSSFNGYRGLTGRQHERPSVIVGKIMERLREAESGVNRARRASTVQPHSATDASPKLATVARNLLNRLRVVRAEGSVLSPDNRAWLEAQGDRSPEPKNKKLIIGKQSFTFSSDGKDLIPCKSRSPSRSPSKNRLSPRNPESEERLTPSPNHLSARSIDHLNTNISPNHLLPPSAFCSDDHLNSNKSNRLSPRKLSQSDNMLKLTSNRLSPNVINNNDKQSSPIAIRKSPNRIEISHHFSSLCNVHRPVPRRRSAGFSDCEPNTSLERKTSEPLVQSCGCRCHPVPNSTLDQLSLSGSSLSSLQDNNEFLHKEDVETVEAEYKILSDLATELTPTELTLDMVSEEQYVNLLNDERHSFMVGLLENALCAYEERLQALELGSGLTRVLYSHLDRASRLLQSSAAHLLVGIAQQVTSLLQHQSSLKQELDLQEKQTELNATNEIS